MANKLSRAVTYYEGLTPIKSHNPFFIYFFFEVDFSIAQVKFTCLINAKYAREKKNHFHTTQIKYQHI